MANKKVPLRKCVGCNEMKDKTELIRVIKTPEDEIVIDAIGKKNGRGAYICKNLNCLKTAIKSNALSRSLKVSIPQEVFEELEKELSILG